MEDEFKFEKALEDLEKIVDSLESGELTLDEALKRFEQGVKLSRACTKRLSEAERKVEALGKELEQWDEALGEGSGDSEKKVPRKKKGTPRSESKAGEAEPDFLV